MAQASVTCDGLTATIVGTNSNNTLVGTDGVDVIAGLGGNDTISGLAGDDHICAGGGTDTVYGESATPPFGIQILVGNDRIFGEGGVDTLLGDFGSATITAGVAAAGGSDYIDGGEGADVIAGYALSLNATLLPGGIAVNQDVLIGGVGGDTIYGEFQHATWGAGVGLGQTGNSAIYGGDGDDMLYGDLQTLTVVGAGTVAVDGWSDIVDGGAGNDTIYGDAQNGNQKITPLGNGARDDIDGGTDSDTADGGPAIDTCTNVETATNCEGDANIFHVSCVGTRHETYDPGITNQPQTVHFYAVVTLDPCVSPVDPDLHSGSYVIDAYFTASCSELLMQNTATPTITWNTGRTSKISSTYTNVVVADNLVSTGTGTVVDGQFVGDRSRVVVTLQNLDPLACEGSGVTSRDGQVVWSIYP